MYPGKVYGASPTERKLTPRVLGSTPCWTGSTASPSSSPSAQGREEAKRWGVRGGSE
jgi:hypothetical protein